MTTTEDQNWRCWCSTMNVGATPCSVCTTPKLLMMENENNSNAPPLRDEEEKKENESESNSSLLCLVVPTGTTMGAGKVVQKCLLTTLSVAWRDYQHSKHHPEHASLTEAQLNSTDYNNIAVVTSSEDLSKLESRGAVCGLASHSTTEGVLALGPAPLEQLRMVLPNLEYLDFKSLTTTEGECMEDVQEELQVIQKFLHRVLTEDPNAAAATEETKKTKKKLKPNDKCHCGSGKKYKKCCATSDATTATAPEELPLEEAVTELLLNASKSSSSSSSTNNATCTTDLLSPTETKGEKVASYRKQVEYGAKKYIKP